MRKLFLLAAASLMAVPAFAANAYTGHDSTKDTTITVTIAPYAEMAINPTSAAIDLDWGVESKRSGSATGTISSATNDPNGASITVGIDDLITGVPRKTAAAYGPLATAGLKNGIACWMPQTVDSETLVIGGPGLGGYQHALGDAYVIAATLGSSEWHLAPAQTVTVTMTASMVNN